MDLARAVVDLYVEAGLSRGARVAGAEVVEVMGEPNAVVVAVAVAAVAVPAPVLASLLGAGAVTAVVHFWTRYRQL